MVIRRSQAELELNGTKSCRFGASKEVIVREKSSDFLMEQLYKIKSGFSRKVRGEDSPRSIS